MSKEETNYTTFFADTSDIHQLQQMIPLGIFKGITTNPGIVASESPGSNPIIGYRQIASEFPGVPFSIQLLNQSLPDLIEQGKFFAGISPDVIIKVPMFGDGRGLAAIAALHRELISVNVTALMSAEQLLPILMLDQNPKYVSLFFNRMKDHGTNPLQEIANARELIEKIHSPSRLIIGSIRHPQDIREALVAGAHIVTVTPKVFWSMVKHSKTEGFIDESQISWAKLAASIG